MNLMGRRRMLLSAVGVGLLTGAALLRWLPDPYVYLFAVAAACAGWLAVRSPLRRRRVALAVCAGCAVLAGAEAWLAWLRPDVRRRIDDGPQGYRVPIHDVLGYAAKPGGRRRHQAYYGGRLLYDVTYHIGPDGFRVRPPPPDARDQPALLFFGGSFTFGLAVEDHETLPNLAETLSVNRVRAFNLALAGYGPHHMLAMLEEGMVRPLVQDHAAIHAVYQMIVPHVERVAGKVPWGLLGPRYTLDRNGDAHRTGRFHTWPGAALWNLAFRSHLLRRLWSSMQAARSAADEELFLAVVGESKRLLEQDYQGTFMVLAWDLGEAEYENIVARLRAMNIAVHEVHDILPGLAVSEADYLVPHDRHPTALANKALASYVLETLAL